MPDEILTPTSIGLVIASSDVTTYDGTALSTLTLPPTPSLNDVLAAVDVKFIAVDAAIAAITPTTLTSGLTYDGTPSFSCFTLTASGNLNVIINEIGDQICVNTAAIAALESDDIALDAADPTFNDATLYNAAVDATNISEALIRIDFAINKHETDKAEQSDLELKINQITADFIISGLTAAIGGGAFDVDISSGAVMVDGVSVSVGAITLVMPASMDNYIRYDTLNAVYSVDSVAPAAAERRGRRQNEATSGLRRCP